MTPSRNCGQPIHGGSHDATGTEGTKTATPEKQTPAPPQRSTQDLARLCASFPDLAFLARRPPSLRSFPRRALEIDGTAAGQHDVHVLPSEGRKRPLRGSPQLLR